MGKLQQIGNISIRVYANDHLPPHFHAVTPDDEALIEIETLAMLRGSLPSQARRTVMVWAAESGGDHFGVEPDQSALSDSVKCVSHCLRRQ